MKRPAVPPPANDPVTARQKEDFTAEGAPPAKPAAVPKAVVPKPTTKGPALRKGPPQGRYG